MFPKNSPKSAPAKSPVLDPTIGAVVQYDDDGQLMLAVVTGTKKDKLTLINIRGREIELAKGRLYFLPAKDLSAASTLTARVEALTKLAEEIEREASKLDVREVWSFLHEEIRLYTVSEICQAYFGDDECARHAGLRVAIIRERVHFKRDKDSLEPRPLAVVEELRRAEEAKARKKALRDSALEFLSARRSDPSREIPVELRDAIHLLEEVAASVGHTDPARQKEAREFTHLCAEHVGVPESLPLEKRAFEVLQKAHIFNEHTNLSFIRHEIPVGHGVKALAEAGRISLPEKLEDFPAEERAFRRDLTRVPTFTIDDASTRDMDDALSLEQTRDGWELGIHITDVSFAIKPGTALDESARRRATSLYCADQTVNMLPESVSEGQLSLLAGVIRPTLSVLVTLTPAFEIVSSVVTTAFIKVARRYSYDEVDEALEDGDATLLLLHDIAAACEERRIRKGAIRVHKRDAVPFFENGSIRLLEIDEDAPSRMLVSEMMVLANMLMAEFAAKNGLPVMYRGQERPIEETAPATTDTPEGPAKDFSARTKLKKSSVSFEPQYHAGLALDAYIQATSPIRRFIDLCHQRQFVEYLKSGKPWMSREEFEPLAGELDLSLQAANLASRETKRYWLLRYLEQRGRGKPIECTVVRTDLKSPLVELDEVYFTTLVRLQNKVKLGDRLTLKVTAVDPHTDYLRLG
jgi:exoribonuclease-2